MPKLITEAEFLKLALEVHGEHYDYSKLNYICFTKKVNILCREHGAFQQKPTHHVRRGQGCTKCGAKRNSERRIKPFDMFVKDARMIHGDKYQYDESTYLNSGLKMKIICDIHGAFYQVPHTHLHNPSGCRRCGLDKITKMQTKTEKEVMELFKRAHGDTYDYSLTEYVKSTTKVKVICHKHGVWEVTPVSHYRLKSGCPGCMKSKGESAISLWLLENKHQFISQKTFAGCRDKNPLFFDFYLPDLNLCIEYDGKQHYFGWKDDPASLADIKKKDSIKNKYCVENNIHLIRISYENIKNIDMVIGSLLCEFWLMKNYPRCLGLSDAPNNGRLIEA